VCIFVLVTTCYQFCDKERLHTLLYYRSIAIAANKAELPDMKMLALFGFGSVILRGAACTVNDLLDRDIDKKVTFLLLSRSY
jgi:heme O synthase-like polyprenyltransferase